MPPAWLHARPQPPHEAISRLARFPYEAEVFASLNHPNLARTWRPIEFTGTAVWALDADGKLLHNWVERSASEKCQRLTH